MSAETEPASYKTTNIALLREIVASGEARLQAQLTVSLAADQRALVLAGFFSASIVALVSGAVALFLGESPQVFLGSIAFASAATLLWSLGFVIYSARPTKWGYPGTRPKAWVKDIASKKVEATRLAERLADIERNAALNAEILDANGKLVSGALVVAATALGAAAALMTAHFVWLLA